MRNRPDGQRLSPRVGRHIEPDQPRSADEQIDLQIEELRAAIKIDEAKERPGRSIDNCRRGDFAQFN